MRRQQPASPLEDRRLPVQAKLAASWASLMLLFVYVDLLGLYIPGVIDDIRRGIVWEFEITQAWAVTALGMMAVPIAMIVLSVLLPARANRTINLLVASAYLLVAAANVLGESWMLYFGLAFGLEAAVLASILRSAWSWPRTQTAPVEGALRTPAEVLTRG